MSDGLKNNGIAGKFGAWIAVYGLYLFLAGWTYLDFYFTVFGVNAKSLDIGLNDVIARGFTVLFDEGVWLSSVYFTVFVISVIVEAADKKSGKSYAATAVLLALGFVPTYFISRSAGVSRADADRGGNTKLPHVSFMERGCSYHGRLLYLKGDTLYVYNVRPFPDTGSSSTTCPIVLSDKAPQIPQVWILQVSKVEDLRIDQYQKEAKT